MEKLEIRLGLARKNQTKHLLINGLIFCYQNKKQGWLQIEKNYLENKVSGNGLTKKIVDLGSTGKVAGLAKVRNLSDHMVEPTSFERFQSVKK